MRGAVRRSISSINTRIFFSGRADCPRRGVRASRRGGRSANASVRLSVSRCRRGYVSRPATKSADSSFSGQPCSRRDNPVPSPFSFDVAGTARTGARTVSGRTAVRTFRKKRKRSGVSGSAAYSDLPAGNPCRPAFRVAAFCFASAGPVLDTRSGPAKGCRRTRKRRPCPYIGG